MGHANVDTTLNVYTQVLDGSLRDSRRESRRRIVHYCSLARRGGRANSLKRLVGPARLELATSWFVAVNPFVDPAQLTTQKGSWTARHLDPILDPSRTHSKTRARAHQTQLLGRDFHSTKTGH